MFSGDDEGHGLVLTVVSALVALVIGLVLGLAIRHAGDAASAGVLPALPHASSSVAAAPAPAAPAANSPVAAALANAAQQTSDAASVKVDNGVVRFYFASGDASLAAGAADAMTGVVGAAKAGRTLVIAGYHDASGNAAKNAALAKERAVVVRDALRAAGVPERSIELRKPEQTNASPGMADNAEARRVEITVQ
jgi:outer membrane protein OmpA-like peptidoglycan-associated protein